MPISAKDLDTLTNLNARLIYGSVEKMQAHPNWIECNERSEYLSSLTERLVQGAKLERKNCSPFNVYRRILNSFGYWVLIKCILPEFDKLKESYAHQLKCPIGFVIVGLNERFEDLTTKYKNCIKAANTLLSIEDDKYVRK